MTPWTWGERSQGPVWEPCQPASVVPRGCRPRSQDRVFFHTSTPDYVVHKNRGRDKKKKLVSKYKSLRALWPRPSSSSPPPSQPTCSIHSISRSSQCHPATLPNPPSRHYPMWECSTPQRLGLPRLPRDQGDQRTLNKLCLDIV